MINYDNLEAWFVTGSQHLYGEMALRQVTEDSKKIADALSRSTRIPVKIIYKPVVTTADEIYHLCQSANSSPNCIGLITWMHTFSPAKMWIAGLKALQKPLAHLHTQFNRNLPWAEIDMDFMNLHQSAHGDREFGFICTRLKLERKVIVGYWEDADVQDELATWLRAAAAWHDAQGAKIARFGDNMREVAVTEGDKVEAQWRLGYSVNGYGLGDLVRYIEQVPDQEVDRLSAEYWDQYRVSESMRKRPNFDHSIREAARIELGLRAFLQDGNFKAFTTTFEDLHGLEQLPGLAVQRLMADGYGFGAEGDWKTAALVRAMKVMGAGIDAGTSFMEDYTYHLAPSVNQMKVLGAHMLEVCASLADGQPSLEVHPLSIGGKADPARLVFNVKSGPAVNASLIDLGHRFRLIVNEVAVVPPDDPLPKLPVARAVWIPKPNLKIAAGAWILAGGAHHTGFSQAVKPAHLADFARMAGIEYLIINDETKISEFEKELRWNELSFALAK
ncbi:MAG: L-arabinose isomerase [candidate division KSB1 bacterium]|nr:L-arabinose isomerase [candidate division KSB1 bacterium]MDZ7334137.1 L-arabinose isomerase [candidate division KSB1 bacterium]MDZ7357385.1 L-arabinose isomerase [candidate division KSB1 bacterium]MDZ7401367.1 L-arabinose isomerase [candidate division KSB1 bacterium]